MYRQRNKRKSRQKGAKNTEARKRSPEYNFFNMVWCTFMQHTLKGQAKGIVAFKLQEPEGKK